MKHGVWLVLLVLVPVTVAEAQTCEFLDREDFLLDLGPDRLTLDFNAAPVGQINGGEFVASGFFFDSPLAAPNGQLEIAPDEFFWDSRYLSIDNRPFSGGDDLSDSLEIYVQGSWSAVGFEIVDGSVAPPPGESVQVFDATGALICQSPAGENLDYVGIRAPRPIALVVVNEALGDADDIGYDNFVLGLPSLFEDSFESGNLAGWSASIP